MPPHLSLGARAHRSGFINHIDEEMMGLEQKEVAAATAEHDEEIAALTEIAALKDHPGYQVMRAAREKTIQHYRSGEFAKAASLDPEVNNAQFGQLVRLGILVADELQKELLTVESAADAVEADKAANREQRRQRGA